MSDLVVCKKNDGELEKIGKSMYNSNDNYRNLANVMEHPEFKIFFDKNFNDWNSTKTILMMMKLYHSMEKESDKELSVYEKIGILDNVIKDSEMRQNVVKAIQNWTTNDNGSVYLLEK